MINSTTSASPMRKFLREHLADSNNYLSHLSKSFRHTGVSVMYNNIANKIIYLINEEVPKGTENYLLDELFKISKSENDVVPILNKNSFFRKLQDRHEIIYGAELNNLIQLTPTELAVMTYSNEVNNNTPDIFYFANNRSKKIEGFNLKKHEIQEGLGFYPELITNYYKIPGEGPRYTPEKIIKIEPKSTIKIDIKNNQFCEYKI